MFKSKKLLSAAAAIALMFAAGSADAYTTYQYTYYDKDGDGFIETNEFDTYAYNTFDMDRDNRINNDEWTYYTRTTSTTTTQPTIDYRTFDVWDVNSDKYLDNDEMSTFITETKYYTAYDVDNSNTIDMNEYARYQFNMYDINMDGTITTEEWMAANQ